MQTWAAGFPGEKLMAAPDGIRSEAVFPGPMLKLADAGWFTVTSAGSSGSEETWS